MYHLQERMRGVLDVDRQQNLDTLKILLRAELKQMMEYYMVIDEEPAITIEPVGDSNYVISITAKATRLIDVGKRIR
ncbi:MAG: hypothetical protein FWC80_05065 [Firmicutes bacterium]|nr:hypothetical protein [Bacillota bacterium]